MGKRGAAKQKRDAEVQRTHMREACVEVGLLHPVPLFVCRREGGYM